MTTSNPIPTRYDDQLADFASRESLSTSERIYESVLYARAEGYRLAKAEDAALLEAARSALMLPGLVQDGFLIQTSQVLAQIHAAIAQATGKE